MRNTSAAVPPGFGPILRSSPVLDALGGFMSRGEGEQLEIGLLVGPNHLNARGRLHGGVEFVFGNLRDGGVADFHIWCYGYPAGCCHGLHALCPHGWTQAADCAYDHRLSELRRARRVAARAFGSCRGERTQNARAWPIDVWRATRRGSERSVRGCVLIFPRL